MDTTKVAEHEGVPSLRLVACSRRQTKVPLGVLVPGMTRQKRVLVPRARLDVTPVGAHDVLATLDEGLRACNGARVDLVRRRDLVLVGMPLEAVSARDFPAVRCLAVRAHRQLIPASRIELVSATRAAVGRPDEGNTSY